MHDNKNGSQLIPRRPKVPVICLREAIDKARILYERDGTAGSTPEAAIKHLGYKGRHGASVTMLTALEKYGLTTKANGRIMLTKDAILILLKGGDEQKKTEAIKKCALQPELYSKLWEQYSEVGSLPGDDTLRSQLVTEMRYSPKKVDTIISDFRKTIDFAGLSFAQSKPQGRPQDTMGEAMTYTPGIDASEGIKTDSDPQKIRDYSIPRKGQKVAILRLEYPVTKNDIAQITNWLELMKNTLSEENDIPDEE